MNFLDATINFFSPSAGLRRQQARIQNEILSKRFNDSSVTSRETRYFQGEREGGDLPHDRSRMLTDKSTDLVRRNPYANKAIRAVASRIVGRGFECESLAQNPDGTSFDLFRMEAKRIWNQWNHQCHYSGKPGQGGLTFKEIQHLSITEVAKSGEVLIHYRRIRPTPELAIPFQIEVIEAQRLADDDYAKDVGEGNKVYRGIEFDSDGKRVAYHIYKNNPHNPLTMGEMETSRIPASEILHLFRKENPSQNRGVTWLSPVLDTLHNMGDLIFDELTAAKMGACTIGVITSDKPYGGGMPMAVNAGNEEATNDYHRMYPGQIAKLRPGEKFEGFSPNRPNLDVNAFTVNMLRGVAAGIPGVKASEIHMDFREASFSSEKAAENAAYAEIVALQEWFVNQFLKPIYREVIEAALLAGAFAKISIGEDGVVDDYFYSNSLNLSEANFRGPGTRSINPVDDQNALILAKQNGTLSLQETAAMEGSDWRETIRNANQVYQYAIEQGCSELVAGRLAFGNLIAPIQVPPKEDTEKKSE